MSRGPGFQVCRSLSASEAKCYEMWHQDVHAEESSQMGIRTVFADGHDGGVRILHLGWWMHSLSDFIWPLAEQSIAAAVLAVEDRLVATLIGFNAAISACEKVG